MGLLGYYLFERHPWISLLVIVLGVFVYLFLKHMPGSVPPPSRFDRPPPVGQATKPPPGLRPPFIALDPEPALSDLLWEDHSKEGYDLFKYNQAVKIDNVILLWYMNEFMTPRQYVARRTGTRCATIHKILYYDGFVYIYAKGYGDGC